MVQSNELAQRPCTLLDTIIRQARVQFLLWIPHLLFWVPLAIRFALLAALEVLYNIYIYVLSRLYRSNPATQEELLYRQIVKKGSLHRGKVAVVSGGTSGIGKEIAKGLLEAGYFVHIPARNLSKATNLLATELKPFSNQVAIHTCDLSSIKSIDSFITEFCNSNSSIDLLVNSAGNYLPSFQTTEDGIESHMAVHVMGTFLLTEGLKDLLRNKPNSHVINVVSSSHNVLAKFSLDAFTKKTEFSRVGGYCNAKFAQVLLTKQMALQWQSPSSGPTSIRVNAVHPGMVKSDISRDDILSRTLIQKILNYIFPISILSARRGALTVLWMALSKEEGMGRVTGRYFHDFAEEPASDVLEEAFRRGDGVALLERCRELKSKSN